MALCVYRFALYALCALRFAKTQQRHEGNNVNGLDESSDGMCLPVCCMVKEEDEDTDEDEKRKRDREKERKREKEKVK